MTGAGLGIGMRRAVSVVLIASALAAVGCTSVKRTWTVQDGQVSVNRSTLVGASERCMVNGTPWQSALLAAAAGAAIGAGLDALSGAVEAAEKAGETPATSAAHMNLVSDGSNFPTCIYLWRGQLALATASSDFEAPAPAWFGTWFPSTMPEVAEAMWKDLRDAFLTAGYDLGRTPKAPDFFLQSRLVGAVTPQGEVAQKLVADFFVWNAPIKPIMGYGAPRAVHVALSLSAPGIEPKTPVQLDLGGLHPGDRVQFDGLEAAEGLQCHDKIGRPIQLEAARADATEKKKAWESLRGQGAAADTARRAYQEALGRVQTLIATVDREQLEREECTRLVEARAPLETPWFLAAIPKAVAARTLTLTTSELAGANPALAFASAALTGLKEPLQSWVTDELNPHPPYASRGEHFAAKASALAALEACALNKTFGDDEEVVSEAVAVARAQAYLAEMNAAAVTGNLGVYNPGLATRGDCATALTTLGQL